MLFDDRTHPEPAHPTQHHPAQADRIQLNITQHFCFHFKQIPQGALDIGKHEILRQFLDAIIKRFVVVFELQFHIPSVFPQSHEVDGNI